MKSIQQLSYKESPLTRLERLRQWTTWKRTGIAFLLFLVFFIALNMVLGKVGAQSGFDKSTILDFQFGYSPAYVHQLMGKLGAANRHAYFLLTIPDYVLGIAYMVFLTLIIGNLLNLIAPLHSGLNVTLLLPIVAMLSDWTENTMSICDIFTFPNESPLFAYIGSIGTILKWTGIYSSFASVAVFALIAAFRAIRTRSEA